MRGLHYYKNEARRRAAELGHKIGRFTTIALGKTVGCVCLECGLPLIVYLKPSIGSHYGGSAMMVRCRKDADEAN